MTDNLFKRISNLSSDWNIFDNSVEYYNKALEKAGYNSKIKYIPRVEGGISNRSHSNGNLHKNSMDVKIKRTDDKKQERKRNKSYWEIKNRDRTHRRRKHGYDIPRVHQSISDRKYTHRPNL